MPVSISEFKKKPDTASPVATPDSGSSPEGVNPPASEASRMDSLQSMADASTQVTDVQKLSDASSSDPLGPVEDEGASVFSEKKVAIAGQMGAIGSTEMAGAKSMETLVFSEIQSAATILYNVRDLYEKRDWKTGVVLLLNAANAFLAVQQKIEVVPGLTGAIPFLGGVIGGLRGMVNTARVMESMETLDRVLDKVTLDDDDKAVLKAYRKEQKISQFRNVTASVLGFGKFVGEFFGVGTFFSVAQGIVSAVFAIRDFWISSQEAKVNKAKSRLGIEEMEDEDRNEVGEVAEILQNEDDIGWIQALVTGDNFSIKNLVEVYNRLETERQKLKECTPGGASAQKAKERIARLEGDLQTGVDNYNAEMAMLTGPFEAGGFKPITVKQVQKLHDFHVTCMQNILTEAKQHMEKIEWSLKGVFRYIKGEDKEKILKEVYHGRVPQKIDIKLGALTADQQNYFWEKTQKALSDSLIVAQMSKATLIREMRQIMLRNKATILESSTGSGLFSSEASFESDMNQVLNTIDL
ncbi:MAG: hypothetical protein EBZ67_05970 [Chitinophagia bacterium]|nr:hypothetical protein [Chitinophagia bacterium]